MRAALCGLPVQEDVGYVTYARWIEMVLGHIERGMRLIMRAGSESGHNDNVYTATFQNIHDLTTESTFVAKSAELSKHYSGFDGNEALEVSFSNGPNIYTFSGRVIGKKSGDVIIVEQLTDIETLNRREYQRDEIRVETKVYPLSEESINDSKVTRTTGAPVLTDVSFDISVGGMCIVTNKSLDTKYDPYYLVEFTINNRDGFILPSKLVRRSNYARSRIGKYDYGFQFLFKNATEDMARLTKAILSKKLSHLKD